VSEEEARLFVWGPWQFDTGASGQVEDCRTSKPQLYSRSSGKNWGTLALSRTSPGRRMSTDLPMWRRERVGPLRLRLACWAGEEEWVDVNEVRVEAASRAPSAVSPAHRRLPEIPLGQRGE
jgi:hypothetical protein